MVVSQKNKKNIDILLIRPVDITMKNFYCTPYMGIGYLATAVRKKGYRPRILHCIKERMRLKDFANYIRETKPPVCGVTSVTYDVGAAQKSIEIIKQIDPNIKVIVGGPHMSAVPKMGVEDFWQADYWFIGEGELGLPLLLDHIYGKSDMSLKNIPGLAWRENGKADFNERIFYEDVDELDMPAWDLMDPRGYEHSPFSGFARHFPLAPMISARGCPYKCTFCSSKYQMGRRLRKRSVGLILEEMKLLIKNYGVREIQFLDDCFTADRNNARAICEGILKEGIKIAWQCPNGVRVDTLDEETLRIMKRAGCYHFAVGIEATNPQILKKMKKDISLELVEEKIALSKKVGIKVTGFFIIGFPGETKNDIFKTIKYARKLSIDKVLFSNFWPSPGTEIYNELEIQGRMNKENIGSHYFKASFPPEGMTSQELKRCQLWGHLSFYLRPKIISNMMEEISSLNQVKNLFKKGRSLFTMR